MIYLDQHAEPNDIARTLWRELGPQTCMAIASTLAARVSEQLLILREGARMKKRCLACGSSFELSGSGKRQKYCPNCSQRGNRPHLRITGL